MFELSVESKTRSNPFLWSALDLLMKSAIRTVADWLTTSTSTLFEIWTSAKFLRPVGCTTLLTVSDNCSKVMGLLIEYDNDW